MGAGLRLLDTARQPERQAGWLVCSQQEAAQPTQGQFWSSGTHPRSVMELWNLPKVSFRVLDPSQGQLWSSGTYLRSVLRSVGVSELKPTQGQFWRSGTHPKSVLDFRNPSSKVSFVIREPIQGQFWNSGSHPRSLFAFLNPPKFSFEVLEPTHGHYWSYRTHSGFLLEAQKVRTVSLLLSQTQKGYHCLGHDASTRNIQSYFFRPLYEQWWKKYSNRWRFSGPE